MEVSDALIDYLASIKHLGKKSQAGYRQRLTVFAEWCTEQGIYLGKINNRTVYTFLAWLKAEHRPHRKEKQDLSSHTVAGYVRCISAFLHWCLADEEYSQYVRLSQIKTIKMPRQEQFVKATFSDEEIRALFDACQHSEKQYEYRLRDAAILAVLLDTGLRSAELRTLRLENVTFASKVKEDSYITVMGKGRKQREIPLGNRARRALHRYIRECRKGATKTDWVFLSRHGGQLAHESLKDILARLLTVSTLPKDIQVNPHKFRHTFAVRFMAYGGDVYDLSRLMGHSSVAITEGYLKSLSAMAVRIRKNHLSVLDTLNN